MAEVLPLYVLLTVMRQRWEEKDYDGAVALAKLAAPYMHGRVMAARPLGDLAEVPDDELEAWFSFGGAGIAEGDPG